MNAKEVAYIRRRFRAERSSINYVRGVFVNENKQILSEFCQFLGNLAQDEREPILSLIRRTLSGTIGRNLIDVPFSTEQVLHGEEHRLLEQLRKSELKDEDAIHAFYQKAIGALDIEGNYLMMLVSDRCDVIRRGSDGAAGESGEVFSYILCCVCPVKASQSVLSYYETENRLRNVTKDAVVCSPILGIMYPSFDNMSTNIYNCLYYTKDSGDSHEAFADAVLHATLPLPAKLQKENFDAAVAEAMDADCNLRVVEAVNAQLQDRIDAHKESRDPEPLTLSKTEVKEILASCGADERQLGVFDESFDASFGSRAQLPPQNLVRRSQFEIRTPDAVVRVAPDKADIVSTRVIGGVKYLMIRAEGDVVVNGVPIHIDDRAPSECKRDSDDETAG